MSERSIPFPADHQRRIALPVGWGVRTDASDMRGAAMLADWRVRWADENGELARRIDGIERCLDGLSRTTPVSPRLTIFAPVEEPVVMSR